MRRFLPLIAVLLLASPALASATEMTGIMTVTDGDTLKLNKQRIRLEGIDAPESDQTCILERRQWDCGTAATNALQQVINGRSVRCVTVKKDQFKRPLATCYVGSQNLNEWLVQNGWAVSFHSFKQEEAMAKAARHGIWASRFTLPKDWRKQNRRR